MLKITIITVSYNAAATIEQTISSVVHQDYPNIEYIIIDGGSTDGTIDIIKRYDSYGIRWISEPDHGIYDAMNKGIQMASGDYIEIVGADDALTDGHIISKIVEEIAPDIDILCGQEWYVDESSKKQYPYTNYHARDKEKYYGGMIPHGAMFVRRTLLQRDFFDTSYRIAADYKFFLKCYYNDSICIRYSDTMVVFFSASGASSVVRAAQKEDNRIYQDLGLDLHSPTDAYMSPCRRTVRRILSALHLLEAVKTACEPLKRFINVHIRWQKHYCSNVICRWCGRFEGDTNTITSGSKS